MPQTTYFNSKQQIIWFPLLNNPPQILCTFSSFSVMLLCTVWGIILGCPSVPSLWPTWWPLCLQNRSPWWSHWFCGKEKSHIKQDLVVVLTWWHFSQSGTTRYSAHPVWIPFRHSQIFIIFQTLSFFTFSWFAIIWAVNNHHTPLALPT